MRGEEVYRALFNPRTIAVAGASNNPNKLGYSVFENLLKYPHGRVYPINPRETTVQGRRAYSSIRELPDSIDLAVVTVPREHVARVVEEAAEKGAKAAVVITAGFSETGGEGARLERELVEKARGFGVRLVGPNCVGVMNVHAGLNATFIKTPPPGPTALLSQSGALAAGLIYMMEEGGGGLSKFVSLGNMADLGFEELLPHLARDPQVASIGLYVEGVRRGREFLKALGEASKEKPTIVLKGGRTPKGARAASSHTGSLAGEYRVFQAAVRQARAFIVEDVRELLSTTSAFSQPLPRGGRVAVLTNAGGPGVLTVDELSRRGLEVPSLTPFTQEALRAFLPPAASVANPVDMVASARGEDYRRAASLLLRDPNIDILVAVSVVPTFAGITGEEHARGIMEAVRGEEGAGKPVIALFMGGRVAEGARRILVEAGIPVYETPREAAAAAWALAWRAGALEGRGVG